MTTTHHGGLPCPSCGVFLDASTDPCGSAQPTPADVTLCAYCGTLLGFEETGTGGVRPRLMTAAELAALDADDHRRIAEARALLGVARGLSGARA